MENGSGRLIAAHVDKHNAHEQDCNVSMVVSCVGIAMDRRERKLIRGSLISYSRKSVLDGIRCKLNQEPIMKLCDEYLSNLSPHQLMYGYKNLQCG
jgi:hypothetical protein